MTCRKKYVEVGDYSVSDVKHSIFYFLICRKHIGHKCNSYFRSIERQGNIIASSNQRDIWQSFSRMQGSVHISLTISCRWLVHAQFFVINCSHCVNAWLLRLPVMVGEMAGT